MKKGYSGQLDFSSFWSLDPGHRPEEVVSRFRKHMEAYKRRFANWQNTPWLFFMLMKTTAFSMSAAVTLVIFLTFSSLTEPIFMNFIVDAVQKEKPIWIPVILALISSFLSICWFGASTRGDFYGQRGYITVKSVLLNIIYSKVLKLTPEGKLRYSNGEVMNLLATDSERVRMFWFMFLDYFYAFFMVSDNEKYKTENDLTDHLLIFGNILLYRTQCIIWVRSYSLLPSCELNPRQIHSSIRKTPNEIQR